MRVNISNSAHRLMNLASPGLLKRRAAINFVACSCLATSLLGCAQRPLMRMASKEYFPASIYGRASPRVVDGGPIPHGGGQYLVGRPYSVAGRLYVPHVMNKSFTQVGYASWYGDAFHGRRTANGEIYDKNGITAAHPTMPLPSYARVTDLYNGRSIVVRVNDRGPYHPGRVIDVSSRVAQLLDFRRLGTAKVRVDYIGPASLAGSSNRMLVATLTTNGQPAALNGQSPTTIAQNVIERPVKALFGAARAVIAPTRPAPSTLAPRVADAGERSPSLPIRTAAYEPPAAPLPPRRPYNLGAVAGAGQPIEAPPRERPTALSYDSSGVDRAIPPSRPTWSGALAPIPPGGGYGYAR